MRININNRLNSQLNMAVELTEIDLQDLMRQAQQQGEPIYQPTEFGYRLELPKRIGQGAIALFS